MAFGNKLKNQNSKIKNFLKEFKILHFGFSFCILIFGFCIFGFAANIKEPNVAGAFYPSDPQELRSLIQKYLHGADDVKVEGKPVVLISPHAGYIYCGPVAAYGFKALSGRSFDTVLILAASHYFPFHGASVYQEGYFRTPLGDLEIDTVLAKDLLQSNPKLLSFEPQYFGKEHSLEVELPFLQMSLAKGFKIVPIIIGDIDYDECRSLADSLADVIKDKPVLIVASTDFSHYKPYEQAVEYDNITISFLKNLDSRGLWDAVAGTGWNVCGIRPVVTSLLYAEKQGADKISILKYANSGDTAGDKYRVVGYVSALITKMQITPEEKPQDDPVVVTGQGENIMLTKEDKKRLLVIARSSVESFVNGKGMPYFKEESPGLNLKRGVFVTLHNKGELRGCIGLFSSDEPLYQVVSKMAIESSSRDYRFTPVTPQEVKDLTIEVSVLSEPKLIDDWKKIMLGTDGVIVRRGFSSGVFLPQVATETGWDLETFLGELCSQKAGLPRECFKDPSTKIYTFQAEVFSESDF